MKPISKIDEAEFRAWTIDILDLQNLRPGDFRLGVVSPKAGRASVEYIEKAVELVKKGTINAIVTAPISKEAVNKAGYHISGHTEILANLTGADKYAMMLISGPLRVVHVTTHISLKEVAERITESRVLETIELAWRTMKSLGYDRIKIDVAGLNPHSSDGGLFGDEEEKKIRPAVLEAKRRGIDAEDPIPADALFPKAASGIFDVAVAMYHDQEHIPVKLIGLRRNRRRGTCVRAEGANIAIGLPITRTSADHGTAFDVAGKGIASPDSLRQAIRYASSMARRQPLKER